MLNWDNFEKLLSKLTYKLCHENKVFTNSDTRDLLNKQLEQHKVNFSKIADSVVDTSYMIQKYIKEGKKVFFEGANGSLLDLALGITLFMSQSALLQLFMYIHIDNLSHLTNIFRNLSICNV